MVLDIVWLHGLQVQNGDKMLKNFHSYEKPFRYHIIDNFLEFKLAETISDEFPDYYSENWLFYQNALENKKALNNWNIFKPETYKLITFLNSSEFISSLKKITGITNLYPDIGLHGAGLHIHGNGGKLNIHLDYSIHPKLQLQRKLNLILYLTPSWNSEWGGNLEFWSHDNEKNLPKNREVIVENRFNRAILFDTTQNSWHGFAEKIKSPENVYRKSIAVYYLTELDKNTPERKRVLFSPTEEQKNNKTILDLIKNRNTLK